MIWRPDMNFFTNKIKWVSLITMILIAVAITAFAQSNTGTITGQVQDQNGAVVPNATVTVTNLGTNESRNVQTNNEGFYEAASLPTGMYKVSANASGFQAGTVTDIRLAVGDRQRVDVKLGIGGVSAVVQVA